MTVSEALEQMGEVDRADVYQAGHRVAELVRTPDGVEFRNLDDWIERGDAVPLADKYRLGADQTYSALAGVCDATRLAGRELVSPTRVRLPHG